ncbi:MAG TPA: HEPN domain-containing protein [Flavobacteriales bacterium]|nr:HEPN domain-containing protein [Flavobacteriales bacterium]
MKSFRTELENSIVEKDIIELESKIRKFRKGTIDEDSFRSLRLARGVYGQRQQGVQMIRIKIPFGKLTTKQLRRISDVADEYSNGNLHVTTRQDIQIHYVSLDRTPELWCELEKDGVTLREACGNTVRNITASALAGVDINEPFDVSPYAQAAFEYFLRNPVGQDLGRKIKIAFSSSDEDSAYTFIHDLGFIPKIKIIKNKSVRGFKLVIAGGLGAVPFVAQTFSDFIPIDQIIPISEAIIRVFDREGERTNRNKARLKYLIKSIGLEQFMKLVEEEFISVKEKVYPIDHTLFKIAGPNASISAPKVEKLDIGKFNRWKISNVYPQKQDSFYAVKIKLQTGDFSTSTARKLAKLVDDYAANDIRLTIGQGIVLKFVRESHLEFLYQELNALGLAEPGAESTADITTCPGTDTCNLGISNSTGITKVLERLINDKYPDFIYNHDINIKISGCMNACGQHTLANIGFHGSSMKSGNLIAPALQVLLGGGSLGDGAGRVADKVIKVPSKRGPLTLTTILDDYGSNKNKDELFNDYYDRQGKRYFYDLLKIIGSSETLTSEEFLDWGHTEAFKTEIGVGECAGVTIDLVSTLLLEGEEKLANAEETLKDGFYADSIYHSYSSLINGAKALLVSKQVRTNSQKTIISLFDEHYVETNIIEFEGTFTQLALQIKMNKPTAEFASVYFERAQEFSKTVIEYRKNLVSNASD